MFMKNKSVIVVGGSRGIGLGVVKRFLKEGSSVYYFSRKKIKSKLSGNLTHIEVDLKSSKSINDAFINYDLFEKKVDILINVAGINYCKKHDQITDFEFDEVLNVNLKSFFITCKESISRMERGAKIVNVSSIAGRNKSIVSGVHYTSSKAAVIGLTRQLSFEIGPSGININCVCPSQTETDMLMESMSPDERKTLASQIPLRRLASVEDIVNPIYFLCTNQSNYIHGACIDINGGQL